MSNLDIFTVDPSKLTQEEMDNIVIIVHSVLGEYLKKEGAHERITSQ